MVRFAFYTLLLIIYKPHSTSTLTTQSPQSTLFTLHSTTYTSTLRTRTFSLFTLHFTLDPHNCAGSTLETAWNLGLASFPCCARTPTSRPQLLFFTALLLPALPKAHSNVEGGLLNLPQSLVLPS